MRLSALLLSACLVAPLAAFADDMPAPAAQAAPQPAHHQMMKKKKHKCKHHCKRHKQMTHTQDQKMTTDTTTQTQ